MIHGMKYINKVCFHKSRHKRLGYSFFQFVKQAAIMKREYRLYSRKFSMFKNFVVQNVTKFVP